LLVKITELLRNKVCSTDAQSRNLYLIVLKYNQIKIEGCYAGVPPVFLMLVGFHPAEVLWLYLAYPELTLNKEDYERLSQLLINPS